MRKRFTEEQIIRILKEREAGMPVKEVEIKTDGQCQSPSVLYYITSVFSVCMLKTMQHWSYNNNS